MSPLHLRVEQRIRDNVCRACIYETAGHGCSLGPGVCPILSRLDQVIDVVRTTKADTIDPYVERLREVVCANCDNQNPAGHCKMRQHADCALDDYFVMVVDLVEQELAAGEPARQRPRQ